jgi:hypothetical protein
MDGFVKCKGDGCLAAYRCKRHTEYMSDDSQPVFTDAPYRVVNNTLHCDMFWGEQSENIFENLKNVMDGKDNSGKIKRDDA